jgi:hypothetical protein
MLSVLSKIVLTVSVFECHLLAAKTLAFRLFDKLEEGFPMVLVDTILDYNATSIYYSTLGFITNST